MSTSHGFKVSCRSAPRSRLLRKRSIIAGRYRHQFRIQRRSIVHATAALLAAKARIARVTSFDELLRVITEQLRAVHGVGELYGYDTAFRIGAHLGHLPDRVYMHAGTRGGARVLGLPYQKGALEMSDVPAALRHRAPHEVEDILCIYKDRFVAHPMKERRTGTASRC